MSAPTIRQSAQISWHLGQRRGREEFPFARDHTESSLVIHPQLSIVTSVTAVTVETRRAAYGRRPRRWTAVLAALACLVVLWETYLWWTYGRVLTDLRTHPGPGNTGANLSRPALTHVLATADNVFYTAMVLVTVAAVVSLVRPIRRMPQYIALATATALAVMWLATRADVSVIHTYH